MKPQISVRAVALRDMISLRLVEAAIRQRRPPG